MLTIYDKTGRIYFRGTGYPDPVGIPYLHVEEKEGHYVEKIDTSVEPHVPVYVAYPKSEMELMKEEIERLKAKDEEIDGTIDSVLTDVIPSIMG